MSDLSRHIDDTLLARLFEGSLTADEQRRLSDLVKRHPGLDEEIRQIRKMAELIPRPELADPARLDDAAVRSAWTHVAERAGITQADSSSPSGRQADLPGRSPAYRTANPSAAAREGAALRLFRSAPARWAVAASVVVLIAVGWLFSSRPGGVDWREITAARGQTASLALADGSSIVLNADSHVRYHVGPGVDARRVILNGEARFEVASDGRPFLVETPHAMVRVLGTRFTVRARDATTRVAVQHGRVAVDTDSVHVELAAHEAVEVSLTASPVRLDAGYAEVADDWTEGTLSFTRAGIPEVLDEIGRRYDVEITLDGDWSGEESLTGSFPGVDARTTLETICKTFDCTLVRADDGLILRKGRP